MDDAESIRKHIEAVRADGTRRCAVCGAAAECELRGDGEPRRVCDEHLLARFEAAFRASAGPLAAYHPPDEIRYGLSLLAFDDASASPALERALAALPSPCAGCGAEGDVAYVATEGRPPGPVRDWQYSAVGVVCVTALCRGCALGLLLPAMRGRFDAVELPPAGAASSSSGRTRRQAPSFSSAASAALAMSRSPP